MNKRTKLIVLFVLIVAVALGFYYLAVPSEIATVLQSRDVKRDNARFTPGESIDIAMAMKLVTHDPPKMLAPPDPQPPLILFPPSAETLKEMTGA